MQLIREKVFETNSSSCHSISISNTSNTYVIPTPDDEGKIYIPADDFGWEVNSHWDFQTKASYVAIYIRDWTGDNWEKYRQMFEDLIKEKTQCTEIEYYNGFWDYEDKSYTKDNGEVITYRQFSNEGYIDHQSVEDHDLDFMFEDLSQLENFLFNNNYVLRTDNDNR